MTRKVKSVSRISDGIVSYVMTYIVPLTSLSCSSYLPEYVSNVLLFVLIMILYIGMDLVYLNPVLILFKWNIFQIETDDTVKYVLTRLTFAELTSKSKNRNTTFYKISNSLLYLSK